MKYAVIIIKENHMGMLWYIIYIYIGKQDTISYYVNLSDLRTYTKKGIETRQLTQNSLVIYLKGISQMTWYLHIVKNSSLHQNVDVFDTITHADNTSTTAAMTLLWQYVYNRYNYRKYIHIKYNIPPPPDPEIPRFYIWFIDTCSKTWLATVLIRSIFAREKFFQRKIERINTVARHVLL